MLRDHRPYFVKRAYLQLQRRYVDHFLKPQLAALGQGHTFMKPWHVELFGGPITIGDCVNVIATGDQKVRLSVWSAGPGLGAIHIGRYCMLCPGTRIGSAAGVHIADNCMLASNAYITDSDWHGIYNRICPGQSAPVRIQDNVWIGDSAIVCKGVTIGENSIVGAGAVVTSDVPANTVVAGNPARAVKQLDSAEVFTKRAQWFEDPRRLARQIDEMDQMMLRANTLGRWLRSLILPRQGD
jgi:acetyltransferase-like isoleucine patch superfamily enzyme